MEHGILLFPVGDARADGPRWEPSALMIDSLFNEERY